MSSHTWLDPVTLDDVLAAQQRTRGVAVRTPLVRFDADDLFPPGVEIFLKLELLQPIRAYKLRGAWNQIAVIPEDERASGVWTVSSGNMAQATAWSAQQMEVPCTVLMPVDAPAIKVANVKRYGGTVIQLPTSEIEEIFVTRKFEGVSGTMVHPYSNREMMAGSGVISLEILEDLPEVDTVIAPWGGGGLASGMAAALKAVKPQARFIASEPMQANPLSHSLAVGHPVTVPFENGLCDAIVGSFLNDEMFALAQQLLDGVVSVDEETVAATIRLLVERARIVPEGAAATTVAAALSGEAGTGKIVCVISGGNIDTRTLARILTE